jgi:glycosyltransferase involved in cell wall biosynthesis
MRKKALLVSSQIPYPCVNGGIERLVAGYESRILSDFDVDLLFYRSGCPMQMFHYGKPLPGQISAERLLDEHYAFVILFNYDTDFQQDSFIRPLLSHLPCFQFLQQHPVAGMSDSHFRGTITQSSSEPNNDVFVPGGFYDSDVFFRKNGRSDEFVVCVARIHEDKNQLELVQGYRDRIYNKYGLPAYLVGGGGLRDEEDLYFKEVMKFVDGVAIVSNADPSTPLATNNWLRADDVASLFHRARLSVMPSPQESFCVALLEALACGTTCIVNGRYSAFQPQDLSSQVFGSVTGKQGSILDWIDEALQKNTRIDASAWAGKFSLPEIKPRLLQFIQERCYVTPFG